MQWRRDLWIVVLAVGAGLFVAGERVLAATDDPNLITPVLLIGVITAPAGCAAASYMRELRFTLPAWVVTGAATVAGLLGATMAGMLGYRTLDRLGPASTVGVALVEESVTLLIPLAVLWVLPTRRATDGLLIGAAAGAGFAAAQTLAHVIIALDRSRDGVILIGDGLVFRGLLSPAAHLAWAGVSSGALWLAAQEHWGGRSLRRFVLALTGVVLLHALWEGADTILAQTGLTVVSLALLAWALARTASAPTSVPSKASTGTPATRGASAAPVAVATAPTSTEGALE